MLELLQYVTSGFWVFTGCLIFVCSALVCTGWALNAALVGMRGKRV